MLVELLKKSWHVKFYNWVTGSYPNHKFRSLCNYFWTVVFYILCLPLILVWKVIKPILKFLVLNPIIFAIDKQFENSLKKPNKKPTKFGLWWSRNNDKIGTWAGRIWISIMCILFILMIGVGLYNLFNKNGFVVGFTIIFAVIGVLTTLIFIGYGITKFFKSDTLKMIKGMMFSVKNKVCPMIRWV